MVKNQTSIGAILSKDAHSCLKEFGPISTISSLILSCLSRQIPSTGEKFKASLSWTEAQKQKTVEELGENPFPLAGGSLYSVANQEQLKILDNSSIFEQISLEFLCLRSIRGKIDPPQVSREKGIGLTLRVDEKIQDWWQQQFTHMQPGVSHILMAATDWILLTFEEEIFVRLEKHSELLSYALADTTITEVSALTWVIQSKLQAFSLGNHHKEFPADLHQLLQGGLPEFVCLCLVLKYGYGVESKKTVSPRLTTGVVNHLVDLFGNKNTAVAFTAEAFPQVYYATMSEEILTVFSPAELDDLAQIAREEKIGPPQGEFPGLALQKLARLPQAKSYLDRIGGLSAFGKLCMEVAVISCHYVRQGPAITQKKAARKKA